MSLENLKITFEMDGTGIVLYPSYPIHLDSLMAWILAESDSEIKPITRDGKPFDFELPFKKWNIEGYWGWCASVLFVEGNSYETVGHWRKRFRQGRFASLGSQKVNLIQGIYRDYNTPLPVTLCNRLVAYAVGEKNKIYDILKKIRYIGNKRNIGYGRVIDVSIDKIYNDYSIIKNGKAQRFLPDSKGKKKIRIRPPYWNINDRIMVCNIGDLYGLKP